jgi:pimeloyl-ACP methyl ester carboxylesterase
MTLHSTSIHNRCARWLLVALATTIAACASKGQRIDRLAAEGQLRRERITGTDFDHVLYANAAALNSAERKRLYLYIDGDGRPWGDDGRKPAADPTTGNPLALRLLLATAAPAVYLSRPCYQGVVNAGCQPALWTSARYSEAVVATMTAAVANWLEGRGFEQVVLIGYSGGGTLAVLIGERLQSTAAVITVAGNLDIEAWARHHDYLPLDQSLNPASSARAHPWPELHLLGVDDTVVPPSTTTAYFTRFTAAQQRPFANYNHRCCWIESWPQTLAIIEANLL